LRSDENHRGSEIEDGAFDQDVGGDHIGLLVMLRRRLYDRAANHACCRLSSNQWAKQRAGCLLPGYEICSANVLEGVVEVCADSQLNPVPTRRDRNVSTSASSAGAIWRCCG
jgi:hypothetical protein